MIERLGPTEGVWEAQALLNPVTRGTGNGVRGGLKARDMRKRRAERPLSMGGNCGFCRA